MKCLPKQHVSIDDLKQRDDIKQEHIYKEYILKTDVPDYPTPEFHIKEVAHDTNKKWLQQILKSGGFKGLDEDSFSWWSLKINEADIKAAEERLFRKKTNKAAAQQPSLSKFTTSRAFDNENSRYGNFCFTFPLTELMEAYKKQMCEGKEGEKIKKPVLRVYGTKLFQKLIEYVVLVHSPQYNEKFSEYPELTSSPLVSYEGNQIIWKAQAISGDYYVWDQVSLAFHVPDEEVLTFPKERLKPSTCETFTEPKLDISKEKRMSRKEAEEYLKLFF